MKIWCLFSVDCNYDQPDNNLVCWWQEKPSLETLFKALGVELGKDDVTTVNAVKIWTGERLQIRPGDTEYRLEDVAEGRVLVAEGGVG